MAFLDVWKRSTGWKTAAALLAVVLGFLFACNLPAEARRHHYFGHRHHGHHHASYGRHHRFYHATRYAHRRHYRAAAARDAGEAPPRGIAAIVVDANSGRALFSQAEHELRHPASVTKVMTLYLLFEQLEKGRIRLDSPIVISSHAASQAPSKLGLAPGETLSVENAIKAVVTKSANDIAVAIAENIGGDEESFAHLMTAKAHAIGMSRTHFANASGLPDPEQITTAHDLAVLGRAIQDRFPTYYRYFSTHVFAYNGAHHRNHNHLLGRVEGMDGIKTGYTRASGFNLLTSVRRGSHHIVAVVLGGRTAAHRDHIMENLIEQHIASGSDMRMARAETDDETVMRPVDEAPAPTLVSQREEPSQVETDDESVPTPVQPMKAGARVAAPVALENSDRARPAFVSGVQKKLEAAASPRRRGAERQAAAAVDGSTSHGSRGEISAQTTTPSAVKAGKSQQAKAEQQRPTKPGWMIQVGAADDAGKANELLSRARSQMHGFPSSAKAFTEKVQKGRDTLYRARFAGLEEHSADAACKTLKRSGFACFATRN